ncbi:hypothetical protein AXF42_Ash012458 [Apostasia shenzhenica]|uniref:Uncharacterized protein n=1 Tax=Apostasia shenzhenica TaxID=1088818 RepID=A0A2I0AQU5_9ASPA|nr:hypothetical protein AXF42_Ash012458 [Apostasia shenzhenica]
METMTEGGEHEQRSQPNLEVKLVQDDGEFEGRETQLGAAEEKVREVIGGRVKVPQKQRSDSLRLNRRRLGFLLDRLAASRQWREASAVLSVLFAGNQRSYTLSEDRRNFLIAMELQKRFSRGRNYQNFIKATYEIWMSKLSWQKRSPKKMQSLQLELALFYLTQGRYDEALCYTKFLVSDELGSGPFVNLIHGLVLYQLWYASLPEEMQIKNFKVHLSSDANGMPLIDDYQETDMGESSNGHDAVDDEVIKASSRCFSDSSIGNEKMQGNHHLSRKKSCVTFHAHEPDTGQCFEEDEQTGLPTKQDNLLNTSIYFAPGLDKSLLPIQLKLLAEDPEQSIHLYRKFPNDNYRDAVKHLRFALHSKPPVLAALLPLIQLLLLGDRVHEAIMELDKSCNELDSTLSFRLKGRLLQCFLRDKRSAIWSCYENALKRDPTCNYSLERLIKMHKTGNYSTVLLLEMLAMNLDAVNGKSSIWEELASCFHKLKMSVIFDYEDCVSSNIAGVTNITSCIRIPRLFTEGETRDMWRLRCRWWESRHFNSSIFLSEMQSGDLMLVQYKAACAVHMYGPSFEYVTSVLTGLSKLGNTTDRIAYLQTHIKSPLNLGENLSEAQFGR